MKNSPGATDRLMSWFVRARPADDEESGHAHTLLVSLGLITAAFSLLYVAVSYVVDFAIGMMLMFNCFVLLLAILVLFRATGHFRLCANLYLACCFFVAILGCSYYTGGIHSMVLPWFTLVPITAVLLLGPSVDTRA